jgi:P27 family predicted phage terminase small subunit
LAGRKPKPTALKKLAGNPGKRPLNENEPKPDRANIKLPRGRLPKEGQRIWKLLAPKMVELGILTEIDLPAFEMMCIHYALAREAMEEIIERGMLIEDRDKQPRKNPAYQLYRENSNAFKQYLAEFGLTPSSRSRIGALPMEDEQSLSDLLFEGVVEK